MFSTAPQTKILFSHKTFFKNYFVIILFAKVATGRCSVRKVFCKKGVLFSFAKY